MSIGNHDIIEFEENNLVDLERLFIEEFSSEFFEFCFDNDSIVEDFKEKYKEQWNKHIEQEYCEKSQYI